MLTTNDSTPALSGTIDDADATILVSVDGTLYTATNNQDGTWTLADNTINPALADGIYDVQVTATDSVGNVGTDTTTNELTIDTVPPVVGVDVLATNDNTPALNGTIDDAAATILVSVDGTLYTATNNQDGTWTLADNAINPALADGVYDVQVTATDSVGNVGTDTTTNELTIDTVPPVVGVDVLATNDSTPALSGTIDDAAATILVSVDGTLYTATNNQDGTWTLADNTINPALADGIYDVQVTATDSVGNVGTDTTTNELTIDTVPPVVGVASLTTNDSTPALSGTIDDAAATILVSVDGTLYTAINNQNGTWTLADNTINPALADGVYDIQVTATDSVGNVGTDTTTDELTIDTMPPVVGVQVLATNDSTPALNGAVDDADATILVSVDGTLYTATNNQNGTWTLADNTINPALADGVYDIQVTATDSVGNVGTDTTTDELTIDTMPPVVGVQVLATNDSTPALNGTIDDADATILVSVDGTLYTATNNQDGTWTLADNTINPALADGIYDVQVTATDSVGNVGTDTTTDELTIDTMPPVVGVDVLATNDSTPALSGTIDDADATILVSVDGTLYTATNSQDGTWTLADNTINPALADGVYDIQVTATDSVGNVGTDTTSDELRIDTMSPVVGVQVLATNDSTPALSGTVDDADATILVSVDGTLYTATNNQDGTWTLADNTISPALPDGIYDVQVTATDSVGNVGTDTTTDELTIVMTLPQVTQVAVSGTRWTEDFENLLNASGQHDGRYSIPVGSGDLQLASLPWSNVNRIHITFSEDVNVSEDDLLVTGNTVANYLIKPGTFSYDAGSHTATWELTAPMSRLDQVTIALDATDVTSATSGAVLDGEWDNPVTRQDTISDVFPSGDDVAGGQFRFFVRVLPSDANGDGTVNIIDLGILAANWGRAGRLQTRGDFNGDTVVNIVDLGILAAHWRQSFGSDSGGSGDSGGEGEAPFDMSSSYSVLSHIEHMTTASPSLAVLDTLSSTTTSRLEAQKTHSVQSEIDMSAIVDRSTATETQDSVRGLVAHSTHCSFDHQVELAAAQPYWQASVNVADTSVNVIDPDVFTTHALLLKTEQIFGTISSGVPIGDSDAGPTTPRTDITILHKYSC